MRISDWSSDVCSSDLKKSASIRGTKAKAVAAALSSASEAFIRCSISDASSTASIVSTARSSRSTYRVSSSPKTRASKRSEEHTSELQSLMRISYAVFCLKKKRHKQQY